MTNPCLWFKEEDLGIGVFRVSQTEGPLKGVIRLWRAEAQGLGLAQGFGLKVRGSGISSYI